MIFSAVLSWLDLCRDLIVAYWAVANHLGNVQVTNKYGHLVGHVKNHGRDPNHPLTRLYSTNAAQPYHCDRGADIIGLCCVHQAKSGGEHKEQLLLHLQCHGTHFLSALL